jgi:cation:H+ antiporter
MAPDTQVPSRSAEGNRVVAFDIIRIVAGLIVLIVAADRLVISAIRIAKVLNISAVIIGAVIVGFGTSIPEFVVSAIAAGQGNLELAMSNVVASNITNVTLVVGVAAVIAAISTKHRVIRREGLLMFIAVSVLATMLMFGSVGRIEGVVLLVSMVVAIYLLLGWSRTDDESTAELKDIEADGERLGLEILYGVIALAATVVAGQVLLAGVEGIGEDLGLSVIFMGLITGVGTSLPELSASIAGARRGESDIVLGNVLGSNTFNSLGVAGLAAVIGPGSVLGINGPLIALMVGAALIAGVFAFTRQRINRIEGIILIAIFVVYAVVSV